MNKPTQVVLALCNFQVIGCVGDDTYRGAEHAWPFGFGNLMAQHYVFTVIDADLLDPNMAAEYIRHFRPAAAFRYEGDPCDKT